ncbi:hypothetical protein EVAR_26566_1 [Eumeta japonica]|uniref:Uncharacterized protein n=1 Tax=Eumeta variegata TaxID=151549 RepID=A0A4C1W4Y8_EUMVA|nr:hypothetical protein EVAR_26566_1 [Eumeta japonica]
MICGVRTPRDRARRCCCVRYYLPDCIRRHFRSMPQRASGATDERRRRSDGDVRDRRLVVRSEAQSEWLILNCFNTKKPNSQKGKSRCKCPLIVGHEAYDNLTGACRRKEWNLCRSLGSHPGSGRHDAFANERELVRQFCSECKGVHGIRVDLELCLR